MPKANDIHVEAVREKLLRRSQAGIEKYGTNLERTDLEELEWLQHLQEELMDAANYAERRMNDIRIKISTSTWKTDA